MSGPATPGGPGSPRSGRLEVVAPDGTPEVRAGDDLAALLLTALDGLEPPVTLDDGDVVVVTSKIVSKAEGRVVADTDRERELAGETVRVLARRGATSIVRTRHGLTMAAAGIDASNVERGSVVLLPVDPDDSARRLRAALHRRTGRAVGVVVTDTAGRAWREGQTDIAVGAAGVRVVEDLAGRLDAHGNELAVTAPAVADELAGAAELVQGKLGGRPFAVVRGRPDLVLDVADDGPGAVALVRGEGDDLFGWGAREAVVRALRGEPADRLPFGAPSGAQELADAVTTVTGQAASAPRPDLVVTGVTDAADDARLATLAFAHGWERVPDDDPGQAPVQGPGRGPSHAGRGEARLRPRTP